MKINFKDWKKIASEDDHTVFQNKEGHSLKVSHKPLSPKMRGEIAALPIAEKYADGGEVSKDKKDFAKGASSSYFEAAKKIFTPDPDPTPVAKPEYYGGPTRGKMPKQKPLTGYSEGEKMQSYADGGEVDADKELMDMEDIEKERLAAGFVPAPVVEEPVLPAIPEVPTQSNGASGSWAPEAVQAAPQTSLAAPPPVEAVPQAAPAAAPVAPEASALNQEVAGINKQMAAQTTLAKEQEAAFKEKQAQQIELKAKHDKELDDWTQENDHLMQDVKDGHIDPNRYLGSQSTIGRISTGIGLILGGIGAGAAGGPNLAAQFLDKQIERDIDAQKAELGKRETLLSANFKKFGNIKEAQEMTRMNMNSMAADQLGQAAAKATSQTIQGQLMEEKGKLLLQNAQIAQQAALRRTVAGAVGSANKNPDAIPELINQLRTVDPAQAKELEGKFVPGMGLALTPEGAIKVRELSGTVNTAKDGINELQKLVSKPGKSMSLDDRAKADTIAQSLIGVLRTPLLGPGTISEGERKMMERIIADPTKIFSLDTVSRSRLKTLQGRLDKSLEQTAKANGIEPRDPASKLDPKHQKFVEFARANPKDPRSAAILKKLGLE